MSLVAHIWLDVDLCWNFVSFSHCFCLFVVVFFINKTKVYLCKSNEWMILWGLTFIHSRRKYFLRTILNILYMNRGCVCVCVCARDCAHSHKRHRCWEEGNESLTIIIFPWGRLEIETSPHKLIDNNCNFIFQDIVSKRNSLFTVNKLVCSCTFVNPSI
jgi:hypothetical protein